MMKMAMGAITLVGALLVAGSAGAGEPGSPFDFTFRWGGDHVTLGGRIETPLGPASGFLTGRLGRDGLTIDGWFDERGKTWTFELDANEREGVRATIRQAPQRI